MKKSIFVSMMALAACLAIVGCNNPAESDAHKRMIAETDSLRKAHFVMDSLYNQLLATHDAATAVKDGDTAVVDTAAQAMEAKHAELFKAHEAILDSNRALILKQEEIEKNHASGKVSAADLAKDHEQFKADFIRMKADLERIQGELADMNIFHEHFHKE
ncbi:MAG: hypothetical protein U0176_10285 [Bacteroidia bacterium]